MLGDYAWPICYFDSEDEEKASLLQLKKASKAIKKNLGKELNFNNGFVEHQLTDEELLDDSYFSVLDESNCESYNQMDLQILNNFNQQQSNYLDNNLAPTSVEHLSVRNDTSSLKFNSSTQSKANFRSTTNLNLKYPSSFTNLIADESGLNNGLNAINLTKITTLANLAIVVGWGKKHEKADHYSSYLQKSTLCLIPNKVCEHWYRSAGRLMNIHSEMLCAGWRTGGRDACHGDSGRIKKKHLFFLC